MNASTEIMAFGQELNDQTFAICKVDMLIKGNNAEFIKDGNTLSDDQFDGQNFDYILSNPLFGREWKNEKSKIETETKLGFAGRFGAELPVVSDGQMLFRCLVTKCRMDSERVQGFINEFVFELVAKNGMKYFYQTQVYFYFSEGL